MCIAVRTVVSLRVVASEETDTVQVLILTQITPFSLVTHLVRLIDSNLVCVQVAE